MSVLDFELANWWLFFSVASSYDFMAGHVTAGAALFFFRI